MCGIAGFVEAVPSTPHDRIRDQLELLSHRGPDALGWWSSGPAVIGQTRLSIIDLQTGDPPILTPDRTICAVLNGEIYNHRELRAELAAEGRTFRTTGDTEVIAHLAQDLEPVDIARRLVGMFTFAVWDERRQRLVLGRDRLGKKPLYYWSDGRRLVFGSEIKAVLCHPAVPRELDRSVIAPYLTFGYAPTPRTFFDGVRSLPPGHVLTLGPDMEPKLERYWSLPATDATLDVSLEEAGRMVGAGLRQAVERRFVSDVPVGAHLSGGIDSSAVVAVATQLVSSPLPTFTVGFEESAFDERDQARTLARQLGTDHHEYVARPVTTDLVEQLVWHHDQPFGDSSAIPTYLLAELVGQEVTVVLGGDGGDELFGGYERFSAALAVDRWSKVPGVLRGAATGAVGLLPPGLARGRARSAQRFLRSAGKGLPAAYLDWVAITTPEQRADLLGPAAAGADASFREAWATTQGAGPLDRLLRTNLQTYLLDDLLPKADRMSMAHGLEVRSPFLDQDLVELAFRLPPATKATPFARKRVLREAVRPLLPPEVLRRRKKGFGVPLDQWFRGGLSGHLAATVGAPDARIRQFLHGPAVEGVLAAHRDGTGDHGHLLWTLLTLELFLRREGW